LCWENAVLIENVTKERDFLRLKENSGLYVKYNLRLDEIKFLLFSELCDRIGTDQSLNILKTELERLLAIDLQLLRNPVLSTDPLKFLQQLLQDLRPTQSVS
jgi:hypothetical protein